MSEHFSAGVKIILARIESHPEEFKEQFGKWEDIITSVRHHVAGETNHAYGMTDEEIKALHEKFREHIWVPQFNDMVMQRVLDPTREERTLQEAQALNNKHTGLMAQGRRVSIGGWNDPALLQNSVLQPGSITPYKEPRTPTLMSRVGKAIGIK